MAGRSKLANGLRALGVCLAVLMPAGPALAQAQAQTVAAIRVEGNQRVEPETVRSYMTIAVGDPFDPIRIDDSLKALFATGLFADVTIGRAGNDLVVRVLENPVINRIAFEGNNQIADDVLASEVQLRPRIVFTRNRVQGDVQRLLQLYQRSGRFAATVEPKVIELDQNRVDLVFEINEGPVTGVRRIRFIGNRAFSDSRLRSAIQTKEARWWRWLTTDDTYDPDRVAFDQELLRNYYNDRGYADFRVVSAVAQLTPDGRDFFLTFTVEEGQRYNFGAFDIVSEVPDVDVEALRGVLRGETGKVYNASLVEDTVLDLTFELGRFGYAFVDVRPRLERDRESGAIDVTYEIAEGPRVYVDRINITGNVRTLDAVIRREFRIAEGDAFNTAKVRRSVQRVRALGFFDLVDVSQERSDLPVSDRGAPLPVADDRLDLNVNVRERSTGELTFGIGYSTIDQFLIDLAIRERNLLGKGQDFRIALSLATRRQSVELSFTEPYFRDRNVAAGFDIFATQNDFQRTSSYDETTRGFALRAGFPLTERWTASTRYGLRQDVIENVGADASRFVKEQQGTQIISTVSYAVLYDARDDVFFPTEGYAFRFSQELAGIGGSVNYLRTNLAFQIHAPVIREDWIASFTAEEGYIVPFAGDSLRISDRFFLGGNSFRGFAQSGVGPRDAQTLDSLGGKFYYVATSELSVPLGLPRDLGIRGSVFSDVGGLTNPGFSGSSVLDDLDPRASWGVGLNWLSPLGPLRLDFAWPIKKQTYDRTEVFRFSFGTRF